MVFLAGGYADDNGHRRSPHLLSDCRNEDYHVHANPLSSPRPSCLQSSARPTLHHPHAQRLPLASGISWYCHSSCQHHHLSGLIIVTSCRRSCSERHDDSGAGSRGGGVSKSSSSSSSSSISSSTRLRSPVNPVTSPALATVVALEAAVVAVVVPVAVVDTTATELRCSCGSRSSKTCRRSTVPRQSGDCSAVA